MPSDRAQIEEIKEKLDIVQVAEKYLTNLKRSGPNYFALCPFHNEKTPSFSVNQDLQIFKCFGCGESGDVIAFIQKIEGLDFVKALERAAEMAGVTLKARRIDPSEISRRQEKEKLLEANEMAMKYYNYILEKHDLGKSAREYCKLRKLSRKVINKFQIGFAPDGYEHLKKFLIKRGFNQNDLIKWGLLVNKNGKVYDKFRKRLMFPIIDHQGDIVGFSGRLIEKSDYGPKYLNSPETLVYKKKETLYGLFQSKEEIRKKGYAILVEGNVDVLSSHRVGVENIVCPLGTALTPEQCKLIRRYAPVIYFAFDTDEAGEKALIRGMTLAAENNLEVKVLDMDKFKDTDELIMHDAEQWKEVVNRPFEVIELLIKRFSTKHEMSTPKGKSSFVNEMVPYIRHVADEIERYEYIKKVAIIAETDEEIVARKVGKQGENQISSVQDRNEDQIKKRYTGNLLSKKNYLAALLLQHKDILEKDYDLNNIYAEWFVSLIRRYRQGSQITELVQELDKTQADLISDLLLLDLGELPRKTLKAEAVKTFRALELDKVRSDINQLKQKIKKAELTQTSSDSMIKELQEKTYKLKALSAQK